MPIRFVAAGVAFLGAATWALNKNQSVEFAQDLNRAASTSVDAASHNPAGLAFLPSDGLYLNLGSQTILQTRTVKEPALGSLAPEKYEGDIRTWVFPTLQAAYKLDKLAFFAHLGPQGGGGSGTFDDGLPQFDNMILGFASQVGAGVKATVDTTYQRQLATAGFPGMHVTDSGVPRLTYKRDLSFKGDEMILAGSAGAAYKVIPTLSVAAAYRFSYARYAYKGSAKVSQLGVAYQGSKGFPAAGISGQSVDSTINANTAGALLTYWKDIDVDVVATGIAHGAIFGLDFQPTSAWNLGARVEWNSELSIENDTKTLTAPVGIYDTLKRIYGNGVKTKVTEPVVVAGGVSFRGIEDLTLQSSWIYGFAESVDRDGKEKDFHNSLMGGFGVRYRVLPTLELATGYSHDWTYYNDAARLEADGDLPSHYFSLGASLQATPRLKINAGLMLGLGEDRHGISKASGARQEMSSEMMNAGIGLEWSPEI